MLVLQKLGEASLEFHFCSGARLVTGSIVGGWPSPAKSPVDYMLVSAYLQHSAFAAS
jgi:hypothetical protein